MEGIIYTEDKHGITILNMSAIRRIYNVSGETNRTVIQYKVTNNGRDSGTINEDIRDVLEAIKLSIMRDGIPVKIMKDK